MPLHLMVTVAVSPDILNVKVSSDDVNNGEVGFVAVIILLSH